MKSKSPIKKVIMYGAPICPDCVDAMEQLSQRDDIQVEYRNIVESTTILKEFLRYRDQDVVFDEIKKQGYIGIPFFIREDGTKTFSVEEI